MSGGKACFFPNRSDVQSQGVGPQSSTSPGGGEIWETKSQEGNLILGFFRILKEHKTVVFFLEKHVLSNRKKMDVFFCL